MSLHFKFSVGIDVSKDTLDCCISYIKDDRLKIVATKKFVNTLKGFRSLVDWLSAKIKGEKSLHVVLEATGIYHENLCHYLYDNINSSITILLPTKGKYYFKSLNIKTKTDKIDSIVLSQYGLERKSENWRPMTRHIRSIKQLSREYRDLKKQLNVIKNKLHAKNHAYKTNPLVVKVLRQQIRLVENQSMLLEVELKELTYEDPYLAEKAEQLTSVPGIGIMTAITIIGETNGFDLISNGKQLCSYAGLDVQHNDSGQKTGKSRISKKGNKYIRQAMYMPALSACKHIPEMKDFYERINERNKSKKVGLVAVARKLLVLLYTLWKKGESYIVNYELQKETSDYCGVAVASL